MSVYDIIMLIIFIGSVWFGFRKGLAWQVASVLSIVLSYFVAVNFRNPVAALISAQEPWNQFAAMLILFLGTSLVVWTVFASFSRNIKKMNMGGFDRQAGAILGAFKGGILCMLATVFAVSLFQPTRDMVHNSKAGHYVVSGIRQFARFTPSELVPYLEPHYQNFDNSIGATPEKKPLFDTGNDSQNFQVNQNTNFQTFPSNSTSGGGFTTNTNTNTNFGQQNAPAQTTGQFQTPWQQPNGGFGVSRPATNQNYNQSTPYSQNLPNNQTQTNNGSFYSTGFGRQNSGVQNQQQPVRNNGQFYQPQQTQTQPLQNGYGQPQQQRSVTVGENGWPEINTKINTGDVLQRGVETTAEMLRRAYESNVQPR